MPALNSGVLDGIRRLGAKVRELTIDGNLPGAPLGYRLRGATAYGPPQTGTWKAGDVVPDRTGNIWTCLIGGAGLAAGWAPAGPWFSVKGYGATGNGIANDSPAIAAAIAAALAVGGGVVYFPPGTYFLGTGPVFNTTSAASVNNIWLRGAGRGATTLLANGAKTGGNADLVRVTIATASTYANNVTISDMTLNCAPQGPSGNGMTLEGISNLTLYNLHIIQPWGYGITWGSDGGGAPYVNNLFADLIHIEGERNGNDSIGGGGITNGAITRYVCTDSVIGGTFYTAGTASDLTDMVDFTYRSCYASTSNPSPNAGAFETDFGAVRVTWDDCHISGFKYGLVVSSTAAGQASDITVKGMKSATTKANAIFFDAAAGYGVQGFSITDCLIDAWDSSASAAAAFQIEGGHKGRIAGNEFAAGVTTAYAIILTGDLNSTSANPPTSVVIENNDVTGCTYTIWPRYVDPAGTCIIRNNPGYGYATASQYNIMSYGAAGNGTTDDNPAIVAANTAAGLTGGTVYFPPGNYRTSHPLAPATGTTWAGTKDGSSVITVLPSDYGNFGYSFVIAGTGTDVHITDLQIDGQKRNGSNPANQCGSINLGTRWLVERCHFYDPNYFGVWVGTSAVDSAVIDCQSSLGGNNDSIGGGGGNNVRIIRHRWNANLAGNRFDNVGGDGVVLEECTDLSTAASGVYFEGMTRSGAINCNFKSATSVISIQTDKGYSPATVTNPYQCFAIGNRFPVPGNGGIQLEYYESGPVNLGGQNEISGNTIEQPKLYGILVAGTNVASASIGGDIIERNRIHNANQSNAAGINTGTATASVASINLASAYGVKVRDNDCRDTRATAQVGYQIHVGGGASGGGATSCEVLDNDCAGSLGYGGLGTGDIATQQSAGIIITGNKTAAGIAAYGIVGSFGPDGTSTVRNNPGYVSGTQTVAVPLTTVATAALAVDSTYYVKANASGTTTVAISGGPTISVPASSVVPVRVLAGRTLTPAYTAAPTWVVEGD
jgi:hypothetical protein